MNGYSYIDFIMWICGNEARYAKYVGLNTPEQIYHLNRDDRLTFVLLVWNAEGCPEI